MRKENGTENVVCRSWGEGMEAVVKKRGGTGRKRMTGAGEDGEGLLSLPFDPSPSCVLIMEFYPQNLL
jgi:hypothetical protein